MPEPDTSDERAMRSFDERLDALSASRARKPSAFGAAEGAAGAGYRLVAELVGGVLAGLGLGWVIDKAAHTTPWGVLVGVLLGTGASVFLVARSAGRMSDTAQATHPAPAVVDDDDEAERDSPAAPH